MVIELVAGRVIAPIVGVSLYTWTGIISVILAGIAVGNFLGGKLADRAASRRTLGATFIAAGLGALSILALVQLFGGNGLPSFGGVALTVRMTLFIALVFFLPSVLLGVISPLVIKLSLQDLSRTGSTIGRIYAASSIGSIVGTFATGYFLLSWFRNSTIVIGTGIVLIALGVLLGNWFSHGEKS